MSAPLILTAEDVDNIGSALRILTRMTRDTGVRIDAYEAAHVRIGDAQFDVAWDDQTEQYVIDDRIGS